MPAVCTENLNCHHGPLGKAGRWRKYPNQNGRSCRIPAHYSESSARENLIEHVFLGELLRGLWRKNIRDLEVLRPEVDSGGYDLALEFRGLTRHVQLKSSYRGARRADVTASVKLLERPSACILWIFFDPDTLSLGPFLWFGSAPGERMPSIGEKDSKAHEAQCKTREGRSSGPPRHPQEPLCDPRYD